MFLATTAVAAPPEEPPVAFDKSAAPSVDRSRVPAKVRPLLPKRGVYAAGGGLMSSSWRAVLDLETGVLKLSENASQNSKSFGLMSVTTTVMLSAETSKEVVGLANKVWKGKHGLPNHPNADYGELIVLADDKDCFVLDGYGPFGAGAAKALIDRLRALATISGPFDKVSLLDVQGLFGGRNVYVSADGVVIVQSVDRGMYERRFKGRLKPEQLLELSTALTRSGFFTLQIPDRLGVPDEARPTITVTLKSGASRSVARWANDKNAAFDVVYGLLKRFEKQHSSGSPARTGRYNHDWRP